jgi:hypothetical protein
MGPLGPQIIGQVKFLLQTLFLIFKFYFIRLKIIKDNLTVTSCSPSSFIMSLLYRTFTTMDIFLNVLSLYFL